MIVHGATFRRRYEREPAARRRKAVTTTDDSQVREASVDLGEEDRDAAGGEVRDVVDGRLPLLGP